MRSLYHKQYNMYASAVISLKTSALLTSVPSFVILVICIIFSIAVRPEYTDRLKDRVLKPVRKLSLVVTFVPSESARPDQIIDLIKELYILIAVRPAVSGFVSPSAANRYIVIFFVCA